MIFQEPMTALNPLHTIEQQIAEVLRMHTDLKRHALRARVIDLLTKVEIHEPQKHFNSLPHQLSGGQRQRVMIAMALANSPRLLIADEPTTALDVTVQARILELLVQLKKQNNMSMLFITHNLAIVRRIADRVYVMRKGKIVESGPTNQLFENPQQPYTKQLLAAELKGNPLQADGNAPILVQGKKFVFCFQLKKGYYGEQ